MTMLVIVKLCSKDAALNFFNNSCMPQIDMEHILILRWIGMKTMCGTVQILTQHTEVRHVDSSAVAVGEVHLSPATINLLRRLTLCRAQRPKTSARGRGQNVPKRLVAIGKLLLLPNKEISIQSRENLVNNNSTRLPLLPPGPFAFSLCSKRK